MELRLSRREAKQLAQAIARERRVRPWRRYRAIQLLAEGQSAQDVAHALACSVASVYNWADAWRRRGIAGLTDRPAARRWARLTPPAERLLVDLLRGAPEQRGHWEHGWTVPLLQRELYAAGFAVSTRTIRRTLHRLGYRWKRSTFALGRSEPALTPD